MLTHNIKSSRHRIQAASFSLCLLLTPQLKADPIPLPNQLILHYQQHMPKGGGYSLKQNTEDALARSISIRAQSLLLRPEIAKPSYCSSATYLVLLQLIKYHQDLGQIRLSPAQLEALRFHDEPDGHGIWGRWNANGPSAAKLISDLKVGTNFEDPRLAQPGDFMKIFWNKQIGKKEHGHLVIYLGHFKDRTGTLHIRFWSSNQPKGYGTKTIPAEKIKWAIFTRIEKPQNFTRLSKLPAIDPFLADMLTKDFSRKQVRKAVKMKGRPINGEWHKSW